MQAHQVTGQRNPSIRTSCGSQVSSVLVLCALQLLDRWRPIAAARHVAATPQLLRELDSPAFRSNFSALLPLGSYDVALPARQLLARAEAQWNVAEIVHNFDPRPEPTSMSCVNCVDPDLAIARNTTFWVNDWEMLLLANTSDPPSHRELPTRDGWPTFAADIVSGWLGGASIAEAWGGYPAFTGPSFEAGFDGWPATLSEAAERPIYTVVNQRRSAAGATYFGPVGIVFNRTWARQRTLVAALDTGEMEGRCNTTWQEAMCGAPAAQFNSTVCHERTWFCGWDATARRCGVGAAKQPVASLCTAAEDAGMGELREQLRFKWILLSDRSDLITWPSCVCA